MLASMSYGTELKAARAAAGLTQEQAAERIGVTRVGYRDWEEEKAIPTRKHWLAIESALGLRLKLTAQEGVRPYGAEDGAEKYAYIPRLDVAIPAGSPREVEHEEVAGTFAYRRDWLMKKGLSVDFLRVIEVDGDSMSPTVNEGDVILVNTADKRLKNGEVYAFRTEDGPRLKRLIRQLDGRIRVVSDNADKQKYPDEFLTPGMQAEVIGHVVHRSGSL